MKIFKNPNRGKTQQVSQESYIPEYVRLDREPIKVPASREEFRRQPKRNVPPQIKVNSGQNSETTWVPPQQENKIPAAIAYNKPQPTETVTHKFTNVNYDERLSSQAIPDFSNSNVENINDDDVAYPPDQSGGFEVDDARTMIEEYKIDFSTLMVGEYVVIYDNDIIAAGDLDDITSLVENILTSEEYNIDIDKLAILKKMNLSTGVSIG